MPPSAGVAAARVHYAARSWRRAFDTFSAADALSPLGGKDLEAFAWSAALTGQSSIQLALLERVYDERVQAGDFARAARAAFSIGFSLFSFGERGRGGGWLARAEFIVREHLPGSAESGLVLLPESWKRLVAGDVQGALDAAQRAASIGAATGDGNLQAFARNMLGRALVASGRVDEGLRALDEAVLHAMSGGLSPMVAGIVYSSAITASHSVFAFDRCREWMKALSAWCDEQPGIAMFTGPCLVTRSEVMQIDGEWNAAAREAQRALELARARGAAPDAAAAAYQLAELRRLAGDNEAAEELYREAMRQGIDPQPGLSLLRLAQGDASAAVASIRRVCDGAADDSQRLRHFPAAVEILLAARRIDDARECAGSLRAIAARAGAAVLLAVADRAQSMVLLASGDAAAALAPARRALEAWQAQHAPYLAARMRAHVARVYLALGDAASARWELDAALQEFESLGAAPDIKLARELQRGCAPPADTGGAAHPLTRREVQVLGLVTRGWSNKVIARELSLSGKTVDRHLSNIFDKLGVRSRTAAAAYAIERGLVAREPAHG